MKNLGTPLLKVAIRYEPDIVTLRQKTKRLALLLGFDNQDQARIATSVSELARNVFQYVGQGHVEFFLDEKNPQNFNICVVDSGEGIAQLQSILDGSYVSKTGMGVGLMGTKKLMDYFDIESTSSGTRVTIGKSLYPRSKKILKDQLPPLIDQLMEKPFETPFEQIQNQNRDLLIALEEVKTAREELTELNNELSETNRGVVALYAELDQRAESLQKANEVKTSFLSHMTHEFRTPISSVISLTRILLSELDGPLNEEQTVQVTYIQKSAETLLTLVNDLLDLAKVESGRVSVNAVATDIAQIFGALRGVFRPILSSHPHISLNFEIKENPLEVFTDESKLAQILRNLISNAVKFTEVGSIDVTAELREDQNIYFTVKDSGIGIEVHDQEFIFEEFSQVHSPLQAKQKGTGLGLPLSRKLAKILGGDLWVESEYGRGSRFHFKIPQNFRGDNESALVHAATDADGAITAGLTGTEKFHVILVGDEKNSLSAIKNRIKLELDAVFAEATDGKTGLQYMQKWNPDLLVLDVSGNGKDNVEFLRSLRDSASSRYVPTIAYTSNKMSEADQALVTQLATVCVHHESENEQRALEDLRQALVKAGFNYKQEPKNG